MTEKKHVPLPKETKAFICANCGAVALDANKICKVQGSGTKANWCGTETSKPPKDCYNKVHNDRWQCRKCGQIAVNPLLLCEPEKIDISK